MSLLGTSFGWAEFWFILLAVAVSSAIVSIMKFILSQGYKSVDLFRQKKK